MSKHYLSKKKKNFEQTFFPQKTEKILKPKTKKKHHKNINKMEKKN